MKPVTGADPTDFALARTGTAGATLTQVTLVSGSVYTVAVSGITGKGNLGLNLIDNDSITAISDGTPLGGVGVAGVGNGSFTGQAYTIDPAAISVSPQVVSIDRTRRWAR